MYDGIEIAFSTEAGTVAGRNVIPARLQKAEPEGVRCLTCERRCLLRRGQEGWCRTRFECQGTLYSRIYAVVSSLSVNPIEKKPLFHFFPGSRALTVGSWSCNFDCPWCQNWNISKQPPPANPDTCSAKEFVALAVARGCQGTSISFNEPTLSLEWSLEVFSEARVRGLYNTFVTNGYMTSQALGLLIEAGLDAMNVDLKGDQEVVSRYCGGVDVEHVWRRCEQALRSGLHLELTTLVVPGVNDKESVLRRIAAGIRDRLGRGIPWHLTRYQPAYRFRRPATPLVVLERALSWAREEGLQFVYLGNVPGHPAENTRCPACGVILVRRWGFQVVENRLRSERCPDCGAEIPGVGWGWRG